MGPFGCLVAEKFEDIPMYPLPTLAPMQGYRDRFACMQGDGHRFAQNPINVTENFFSSKHPTGLC